MTAEITVWVFGFITILCLLISGILIGYLLREWKKLDYILEDFQNGELKKIQNYELREARKSRIVSRLLYILYQTKFRENQAVEEKNQAMELISDLSHQLKTPFANIVMNTELLREDGLTKEQRREFLEHTESQVRKMRSSILRKTAGYKLWSTKWIFIRELRYPIGESAYRKRNIILSFSVFIVEKKWNSRKEAVLDCIWHSLFCNRKRGILPYLPSRERAAVSIFFC